MTRPKKKPAASAPVIDVGAPVRAEVIPPPPAPEVPAGVQLGGVPIALPPELAVRVAAIHDQALGLVTLGRELAAGVSTFARALEDARRALEGRPAPRRRAPRRRRGR